MISELSVIMLYSQTINCLPLSLLVRTLYQRGKVFQYKGVPSLNHCALVLITH